MNLVTKKITGLLVLTGLLFCTLYFVLDTKPKKQQLLEKSRSANLESTSIQIIEKEAKEKLTKDKLQFIEALEVQHHQEENDTLKTKMKEELSSQWYQFGHPAIAGNYAEEIAEAKNTAKSWSIVGTTYILGIKSYETEKLKSYCFKRAIKALEKAVSLEPNNIDHKINLALTYVEMPPKDNPMTGILQLVGLNKEHPENVNVLNQLGRLAIQTNQFDKAIERLQSALAQDQENINTICLLAEAYTKKNETSLAVDYVNRCEELINK